MFSSDRPIDSACEDLLGRDVFAKRVATSIAQIRTKESIVIGLQGAWGSGKTSVINMIVEELQVSDPDILIIQFNPWNRIEDASLVTEYFQVLKENIDRLRKFNYRGERTKELSEALEDYSTTLKGGKKRILARWISRHFAYKSDRRSGSIEERKKKVSDILSSYEMKILVVIDDIDRLADAQIRSIFQLVTSIADFPSVNYLLSYDSGVVENALSTIQICNGSEYLEKVVQIPIRIPEISKNKVADLLSDEISVILKCFSSEKELSMAMKRAELLRYCVFPYVETIRDLKRYKNVLEFELFGSQNKVSPLDIAAIVSVTTFIPELIPWIVSNKDLICGKSGGGYIPKEAEKLRERYEAEFDSLLHSSRFGAKSVVKSIAMLFPAFGQAVGFSRETISEESLRMQKMLVHSDIFDAYFKGAIDAYTFPHSLIMSMAFEYDEQRVVEIIENAFKEDSYGQLLEGFLGIANEIDTLRAPIVFQAFLMNIGKTRGIGVFFSENSRTIDLLNAMLEAIGVSAASLLAKNAIGNLDIDSLIAIAPFISEQERVYERYNLQGGYSYKRLIDLESLEFIEGKFTSVMKNGMSGLFVLTKEGIRIAMYLWEKFDAVTYEKCLKEAIDLPMGKALIAQLFTSSWYGAHTYGWTVDDSFKTYITEEEILNGISEAILEESFWELPIGLIERVAAFAIGIEGRYYDLGEDRIDKAAVEKQIEEWKSAGDSTTEN